MENNEIFSFKNLFGLPSVILYTLYGPMNSLWAELHEHGRESFTCQTVRDLTFVNCMNCKLIESEERLLMLVKGEMTGKGAALLGVSELKKQKLERKKKTPKQLFQIHINAAVGSEG